MPKPQFYRVERRLALQSGPVFASLVEALPRTEGIWFCCFTFKAAEVDVGFVSCRLRKRNPRRKKKGCCRVVTTVVACRAVGRHKRRKRKKIFVQVGSHLLRISDPSRGEGEEGTDGGQSNVD